MGRQKDLTVEEYQGLALAYRPLAIKVASRYTGRGAEFDDLLQEACRWLLILIARCRDLNRLPGYLKMYLPWRVSEEAARLRWREGHTDIDRLESRGEALYDEESVRAMERAEVEMLLRRVLTLDEQDLVQAVMEGFTQSEIAEFLGVSQVTVGKRLKKVRKKMQPLMAIERSA